MLEQQRGFLYVFSSDTHVIENQQNKNMKIVVKN